MSLHLHIVFSVSQELLSGIGTKLEVKLVITGASNFKEADLARPFGVPRLCMNKNQIIQPELQTKHSDSERASEKILLIKPLTAKHKSPKPKSSTGRNAQQAIR